MSFFNKVLNLFGFGFEDDDVTFIQPSGEPENDSASQAPVISKSVDADSAIEATPEMVTLIFNRVVEVTNEALPAYFAKSIDPEKQKRYLYDCLDESIKQYIVALQQQANDKCKAIWQNDRDKLNKEMETLKERARDLEVKRSEINEQRLSSDRQRRALSEQIHGLENQILKLEADKEQLEIENRGLINKAKVANVYESDMEAMRKELDQLRANQQPGDQTALIGRLNAEIEGLNQEVKRLKEACEAAKMKDEMGDAMLNDLQSRASESLKMKQELDEKVKELEESLALRDAQIADLNNELADRDSRLEEAEEAMSQMETIVEELDKFEAVRNKLEQRIVSLKDELKSVQRENESLRTTIKNNLLTHAQQEKMLKDRIEQMRSSLFGN